MAIRGMRGVVPIGGIVAWLKSFTNVPSLATQGRDEYVEVDGQTISDVQSPLNGQTLPDINGTTDATRKFLRGSTTSGLATNTVSHAHCLKTKTTNIFAISAIGLGYYSATTTVDHIPPSYTVVWIVRIK